MSVMAAIMFLAFSACSEASEPLTPQPVTGEPPGAQNILIAYFSATGNTRTVAEHIAGVLNASLYEIVPEIPYTAADLNWRNRSSRSITEQYNRSARPAIRGAGASMEGYGIVFVGFPIWNGIPPRIIYTFFESHDFSGKTVIPFSTSNTTGISRSMAEIRNILPHSHVLNGINIPRADFNRANEILDQWLNRLSIGSNSPSRS
jgi:flavodoxin